MLLFVVYMYIYDARYSKTIQSNPIFEIYCAHSPSIVYHRQGFAFLYVLLRLVSTPILYLITF